VSDTDFAQHAVEVATHFWGDPNPRLSTTQRMVWGANGSKKLEVEDGTWFDHEQHVGGGVLSLVMTEKQCDKAGAVRWLETNHFLEARPYHSPAELNRTRQEDPPPYGEPTGQSSVSSDKPQAEKEAVEHYDYVSRDGEPLYRVVRYHFRLPDGSWLIDHKTGNPKKTFAQCRRVGTDWVWNLDGIGHSIYRHNRVEQAIAEGQPVYLAEGEKDVHTLEGWGLTGTTNSGGAKNWTPELAKLFRDADVVVLVDNDDAGRERGEAVCRSLRGIARRVRMLDFAAHVPGFVAKGDVTDWRDQFGGDAQQLSDIAVRLPDWRPSPPKSLFGAVGLHQLHHPSLRHEFLIDGFLDRQGVAMMPGASASGKTFLILEMAMCIALGRDFWGKQVKPGLVLYQAGEGKQGVAMRLDGWMLDRGVQGDEAVPFRMLTRRINLFNDDKDTDELIAECKAWSDYYELPVRMVVVDTFNKAITGANENAGQDMTKVLSRLERISTTLDCAVVVPIHKSAEGKMRGHTSLTGDVANVINVTALTLRDQDGAARQEQGRRRRPAHALRAQAGRALGGKREARHHLRGRQAERGRGSGPSGQALLEPGARPQGAASGHRGPRRGRSGGHQGRGLDQARGKVCALGRPGAAHLVVHSARRPARQAQR
jgi:hypothetical protein